MFIGLRRRKEICGGLGVALYPGVRGIDPLSGDRLNFGGRLHVSSDIEEENLLGRKLPSGRFVMRLQTFPNVVHRTPDPGLSLNQ